MSAHSILTALSKLLGKLETTKLAGVRRNVIVATDSLIQTIQLADLLAYEKSKTNAVV